jgi:mannosyltransferase OCH1-like enzyme
MIRKQVINNKETLVLTGFNMNQIMKMNKHNSYNNSIRQFTETYHPEPISNSPITNNIIPLNLFQTWHTLKLPPKMQENVDLLKAQNPEFIHYLYDDTMCRNFIKEHFNINVLYAFDTLIPGAYKSDLWRLCILYKYGGIYLDIKYSCNEPFKLIQICDKEYWVRDYNYGVYQALMVNLPNNRILMDAINKIVYNVKYKLYLTNPLEITGPQLLGKFFTKSQKDGFKIELNCEKGGIVYNNKVILKAYPEYKSEQNANELKQYYAILWEKKQVYSL